jgi:hypothetical protein
MIANPSPVLGKIVKSNSHIDYVCQVFGRGEVDAPPSPADYSLGAFVAIPYDPSAGRLIGVIYNTLLLNPTFGSLGPRLSSTPDLEILSPDYLSETATLVGIIAIGWQAESGAFHQGVPALAPPVNSIVEALTDDEVRAFHSVDEGSVALRYAPTLLGHNSPIVLPLLLTILDRLSALFPKQRDRLTVVRNNLAWKSIVHPAG